MPRTFEFPYTVALYDTDAANMLFSANLIRICHHAYEAFIGSMGYHIGDLLKHREFGLPVVHIEGDFKTKLTVSDKVTIRVWVSELSTRSFRTSYELVDENGSVSATAALVHVCVDPAVYKSMPLPEHLRQALEPFATSA